MSHIFPPLMECTLKVEEGVIGRMSKYSQSPAGVMVMARRRVAGERTKYPSESERQRERREQSREREKECKNPMMRFFLKGVL